MEGLSRRSSLHLTSLGTIYACQENAWMDEGVMLLWVEKVLKPYVESAPEGISIIAVGFLSLSCYGFCCQ